ncbi:MAG: vitamin K epoxide reductase family protein [Desulfuromonadaceae bacterium]|nr:vitamin K epoxide reductase family protein [Desulfuromonadaceae bacterium]
MDRISDTQHANPSAGGHRALLTVLWLAVATGWLVSIFSVIDEMCLATACSDAASFTIFGFNMGWFGVAYFSSLLLVVWLRKKVVLLDWILSGMVFAGIGSEIRLLWIQKYIIGSWCPLCVTICCSLFVAALLLVVEKYMGTGPVRLSGRVRSAWVALVIMMIAAGLAVALAGVKELT